MYGLRSDCCRSSEFFQYVQFVRRLLEKSMVVSDISLTLCFDCFRVWFLLCKIMYVKGVFQKI
jgi:hypothetical protein